MQRTEGYGVMVRGLVAALCCTLVGCAAAKMSPQQAPAAAGSQELLPDKQAELERLAAEIERDRQELGLPEPDPTIIAPPVSPMAVSSTTDTTCKPAPSDTCKTSCTLSDSICSNADQICGLSKELGDAKSRATCTRASATCQDSHKKCCGCQ